MKKIVYGTLVLKDGQLSDINSFIRYKNCNQKIFKTIFNLYPSEYGTIEYIFQKIDDKLFAEMNFSSDLIENQSFEVKTIKDIYKIYVIENDDIKLYISTKLKNAGFYLCYQDIYGNISEYKDLFIDFINKLDLDNSEHSIFDLVLTLVCANNTNIFKDKKILNLLYTKLHSKYIKIDVDAYMTGLKFKTKSIDEFNSIIGGLILYILDCIKDCKNYLSGYEYDSLKNDILTHCSWYQMLYLIK